MIDSPNEPAPGVLRFAQGLALEMWRLRRSRTTAAEIQALMHLLYNGCHELPSSPNAGPLFLTLPHIKSGLLEVLARGRGIEPAPVGPHPQGDATPLPEPPPASPTAASPAAASPAVTSPAALKAAIDLADWLQRAQEDERVAPQRGLEVAQRKADTLLQSLGLERITRDGDFNSEDQEIVDTIATADPTKDMQISSTVQPGYRIGAHLLRPQRVLVLRHSNAASTSQAAEPDGIDL